MVAVLEVGEEEPGGMTKTVRGRDDPCRGRQRGGNLGRLCAGTTKMTVCSDATPRRGAVAVGSELVQRRDHQQHTHLERHVGNWWHGPKAAALRPTGGRSGRPMLGQW
jgi:hypothetical protein